MAGRFQTGLKLALTSIGFLCLTIVSALALRHFIEPNKDRGPASVESGSIFEHRGNLTATELGLLGSVPLIRGRRAIFHDTQFRNQVSNHPDQVILNLFPDLSLTVKMHAASVLNVNEGIFTGQIEDDPESSVRFLIQNGVVDGTIEYRGSEFRIIDGANGQAIVTQSKKSIL